MAPEYVDFLNRSEGRSMSRTRKLGRHSGGTVRKGGPNSSAFLRGIDGHAWSASNMVAFRYRIAILSFTALAILTAGVIEWYASMK